uniref:Putative secreted protein n=1 Tax=Anopheles darlingi TaxID=43151 RepID=A0A2M4DDU5_ANODA
MSSSTIASVFWPAVVVVVVVAVTVTAWCNSILCVCWDGGLASSCEIEQKSNNTGSRTSSRAFWWGEKSIKGPIYSSSFSSVLSFHLLHTSYSFFYSFFTLFFCI